MKRGAWIGLVCLALTAGLLWSGCEDDHDSDPTGSCSIRGNVLSFDAQIVVSAVPPGTLEGVVVTIEGPVTQSATCDAQGNFVFTLLPPGTYTITFTLNGEEVRYRGRSGQDAVITVRGSQTVELINVRISGGAVNIGNIRIVGDASDSGGGGPPESRKRVLDYTGSAQSYVVPAGVTQLTVKMWGAGGATSGSGSGGGGIPSAGGPGGYSEVVIDVTPGETLDVEVGGKGTIPNGGAFTGGDATLGGGGGGGRSAVLRGGTALAIAGGGGGGGEPSPLNGVWLGGPGVLGGGAQGLVNLMGDIQGGDAIVIPDMPPDMGGGGGGGGGLLGGKGGSEGGWGLAGSGGYGGSGYAPGGVTRFRDAASDADPDRGDCGLRDQDGRVVISY